MSDVRVIFYNKDKSVRILCPTTKELLSKTIEQIIIRAVVADPTLDGLDYTIGTIKDLPKNRANRDSWNGTKDTGVIEKQEIQV